MKKNKVNKKVILYSVIGIGFVILSFAIDWLFIVGAFVMLLLNQRELMHK